MGAPLSDHVEVRVTEQSKDWDGITLEERVRAAVREKTLDQIAGLLKALPEDKKEFYRQVVKDEAGKMRARQ